VAAVGQHEGRVGVGQEVKLEHRPPGRNVVLLGSDREDRNANVTHRHRPAFDVEASFGEIVIKEQRA